MTPSSREVDFLEEWLLEACLGTWKCVPLHFLDNCFELNLCGHNKNSQQVASSLMSISRKGWIVVSGVDLESFDALVAAIDSDPVPPFATYSLTLDGLKEWEQRAKPDWNRYVDFVTNDETSIRAIAGSVFMGVVSMEEHAVTERLSIDWESLSITEIADWLTFMHKRLDFGFDLRASLSERKPACGREEYRPPVSEIWFRTGVTRRE